MNRGAGKTKCSEPLGNGDPMDLTTLARRHAVAVRVLINTVYVAILVWTLSSGQTYGLIVVPFLAYGMWRLLVLLRRRHPRPRPHRDRQ
jgi:fatty acid desaturase